MSTPRKLESRFPVAEDIPAIMQFFRDEWGANHIFGRDKNLLMWQFARRDASFGNDDAPCALTIWDGPRLAGMQGLVPTPFRTPQGVLTGVWLCNLMAADDYRDKGVGLRLMSSVHRLPVDIIATLGINPKLVPLYKQMRFAVFDDLQRLIAPIHSEAFTSLTGLNAGNFAADRDYQVAPNAIVIDRFDDRWEKLFSRLAGPRYFGTDRTAQYMNWRYVHHPSLDYRIIGLSGDGGALHGLAVYRIEQVRDRPEKVIRLLEIWADTDRDLQDLSASILAVGHQAGAAFADHYGASTAQVHRLGASGWCDQSNWQRPVPSLFQPLDFGHRKMACAIRTSSHVPSFPDPAFDFYIVKSDGDQDRAN